MNGIRLKYFEVGVEYFLSEKNKDLRVGQHHELRGSIDLAEGLDHGDSNVVLHI